MTLISFRQGVSGSSEKVEIVKWEGRSGGGRGGGKKERVGSSLFQMARPNSKPFVDPPQYIINLRKTWEKLVFAARAIAAIENPSDVCVITSRPQVQRAILKYAVATGASSVAGRYTPGERWTGNGRQGQLHVG